MSRTMSASNSRVVLGWFGVVLVSTFLQVQAAAQTTPPREDRETGSTCAGNRPPVARAGNDTVATTGQSILFDGSRSRDSGRGVIAAYHWNFADGSEPANGFRVYHSFAAAGNYEVTLTVTDDCGATHTDSLIVTVLGDCQSNHAPGANAGPDRNASVNQPVMLDGSASTDSDGQIVEYWWNFGDGNFTGWQNPGPVTHTYAATGSYQARLWVRDNCGQMSASDIAVISVSASNGCSSNASPTAAMAGPTAGEPNQALSFSGAGSTDAEGQLVSFQWSFGDGVQQSGVNVTHAYAQPGNYQVSLTVTDHCGATATSSRSVTIQAVDNCANNTSPIAHAGPDRSAVRNTPITLDGSASFDADGQVVQYWWNFGDGGFTGWQNSAYAIHTYLAAGEFHARLWVRDHCGAMSGSDVAVVTVVPSGGSCAGNVSPEAVAGDDKEGQIGEALTFSAAGSFDPDGQIQSYHWLFSDGQEADGMTVTRAFLFAGTFLATLTVTDQCGAQDVDLIYTEIAAANPCADDLTVTITAPQQGTVNQPVTFQASSLPVVDLSYSWTFGDDAIGAGASVSHIYSTAGAYEVTVTVTQVCGDVTRSASAFTAITISAPPACQNNGAPIAVIDGPTSGPVNTTLAFNGSGSLDFTGQIVDYSWNFGDGQQATGVQVSHTYSSAGSFNLSLTVTDQCGLSHTSTRVLTITNPGNQPPCGNGNAAPVANAGPDRQVPTQQSVTFDASASSDVDGLVTQYWWNFGDGEYTNWVSTPTVTHAYASAGAYELRLWVKDNCGNMSSPDVALLTVGGSNPPACANNAAPTAHAGPDREGTVGVAVNFVGAGSDADGQVVQYRWGFGDGQFTPWQNSPNAQHTYVSPGTFTATLQVRDNCDAQSSLDPALVNVAPSANPCTGNQSPTANAGPNVQGSVNVQVFLSGQGSSDPEGQPLQYQWQFGDGQSSNWVTSVSVPHVYTQPGTYTATLTVKDSCGAVSQPSTTSVLIPAGQDDSCTNNTPPIAEGGQDRSVIVAVPVTFNGTLSYDPQGQALQYWWNFGDGSFTGWQSNAVVEHTYANTGNYYAKLWVRDTCGAASQPDNMYITVTPPPVNCVGNQPPTANAGNAPNLDVNEVHVFTAAGSSDPNHSLDELTFHWSFGDGTSATGYSVSHSYPEPGTYMVSLMVTDPCGRGDVDVDFVDVIDSAPAAQLVADFRVLKLTNVDYSTDPPSETWEVIDIYPTEVDGDPMEDLELGRRYKFDASPSQGAATYLWNFGTSMGTGAEQIRAFHNLGPRSVSLTVYNPAQCGACSHTVLKTFNIRHGLEVAATFAHDLGLNGGISRNQTTGDIWVLGMSGKLVTFGHGEDENELQMLAYGQHPAQAWDIAVSESAAVVTGGSFGMFIYDATSPTNLASPVAILNTQAIDGSYAYKVALHDHIAYLSCGNNIVGSLKIVDISNIANPVVVNELVSIAGFDKLLIKGNYLLAGRSAPWSVRVLDITDPVNPVEVSTIGPLLYRALDMDIRGDLLAIVEHDNETSWFGLGNLVLFDISNPLSPVFLSRFEEGITSQYRQMALGEGVAFVSDITEIKRIDITDPRNPYLRNQKTLGVIPGKLLVHEHRLYAGMSGGSLALTVLESMP